MVVLAVKFALREYVEKIKWEGGPNLLEERQEVHQTMSEGKMVRTKKKALEKQKKKEHGQIPDYCDNNIRGVTKGEMEYISYNPEEW
jgi:hypothetical protein